MQVSVENHDSIGQDVSSRSTFGESFLVSETEPGCHWASQHQSYRLIHERVNVTEMHQNSVYLLTLSRQPEYRQKRTQSFVYLFLLKSGSIQLHKTSTTKQPIFPKIVLGELMVHSLQHLAIERTLGAEILANLGLVQASFITGEHVSDVFGTVWFQEAPVSEKLETFLGILVEQKQPHADCQLLSRRVLHPAILQLCRFSRFSFR